MADFNPKGPAEGGPASPADKDAQIEFVVLEFVIGDYPDVMTIPELARSLNLRPISFDSDDAVECAVRELDGAGLLRCPGGLVMPTRAALYFERLQAWR